MAVMAEPTDSNVRDVSNVNVRERSGRVIFTCYTSEIWNGHNLDNQIAHLYFQSI